MKSFNTSTSSRFIMKSTMIALALATTCTIQAQGRLVLKGSFISQITDADARVEALLIASDGTQMPIDLSRKGHYKVNAPANDTYVLRFAQPGCVTKEVYVDGRNAITKPYQERMIKFDMALHADHPEITMRFNGPVAEIAFEEGTGEMTIQEQYQMIPVSSFTAQEF